MNENAKDAALRMTALHLGMHVLVGSEEREVYAIDRTKCTVWAAKKAPKKRRRSRDVVDWRTTLVAVCSHNQQLLMGLSLADIARALAEYSGTDVDWVAFARTLTGLVPTGICQLGDTEVDRIHHWADPEAVVRAVGGGTTDATPKKK